MITNSTLCMRQTRGWLLSLTTLGIVLLLAAANAAKGDPVAEPAKEHLLDLKTERVIVFKDGYSLVLKRGSAVTDAKGEIHTVQVPDAAVLGSFWAIPKEGRMISMVAGWKETSTDSDKAVLCMQNLEVLQANKGKVCKVELNDKTVFTGTIREVLAQKTTGGVPGELRAAFRLPETPTDTETISGLSGSNFILRTEEGDVLLPVAQVRTLTVRDLKTTIERTVTTKKRTKMLSFRFEKPGIREELTVMYFRPGLRWIPTYRIQLSEDEKKEGKNKVATLAMQAEIINEAEDLADVPVDIVVGVPHFRFHDTPSPLVLEQTMRNALVRAAPQLMSQMGNNSFYNGRFDQQDAGFSPAAPGGNASVQLPGELTAAGAQDLFVYNLPKIAFKKGERVAVQVFTAQVPYRDVYTWDLHLKRRDIETSPSAAGVASPLVLSRNEVWHQIDLSNNTDVPWTTGSALIMQGNQPLGQDILSYTPGRGAARVPVTVSVDTRGTFREEEIGRQLQAITWDGYHYAKIEKQVALRVQNSKKLPVDLEITLRFGGKFTEISDKGRGTLGAFSGSDWEGYRGSGAVNNTSAIQWSATLVPGKTFEPTAKYYYYTRH